MKLGYSCDICPFLPLFVPQVLTIDQKCKKYILIQHVSHEVGPILIQT